MPKVSVIMGVHNGEKTLRRAIDSILSQSFTDFEFLICNDASSDSSENIINEYLIKDQRIKYLKNDNNSGLSFSLNRCIDIASGDYIARMDDDDISHPDRFEKQVLFLDDHPQYAIVGCCRRTFDERGVWNTYGQSRELTKEDIIKCDIFTHPTVMVRKDALIQCGNYTISKRTMRGQDFDLWCKMYSKGYIGYVMPDVLFDYYEDRNKIKEVKAKYRFYNFQTHMLWRKKMGLPAKYDIYAYKELLAIIIPNKILASIKKKRYQ